MIFSLFSVKDIDDLLEFYFKVRHTVIRLLGATLRAVR